MRRPRPRPLAIAVLSLVMVAVSCVLMARRIVDYNLKQGRITYLQLEVHDREFNFAGRPVTLVDLPPDGPESHGAVRVSYGEDSVTLPVTIPPLEFSDQFPGLERHGDWFRVVRFAQLTGRNFDELAAAMDAGVEGDRLVIVSKTLRAGANPDTWGRVWRKDWIFTFYEFNPEGGFTHERLGYPTVRTAKQQQKRREDEADGEGGLPELDTRSWQFQIADLLMPEGSAPRIIKGDSPLVGTGWTFPVAVFSVLAATFGLLLAFAPDRTVQLPAKGD
jgi:hypothetical protein